MVDDNLKLLATELMRAVDAEKEAKAHRIKLEDAIAKLVPTKAEGTTNIDLGSDIIKIVTKLTRTLDYDTYLSIENGLPDGLRCVDLKPSLNLTRLRALELVDAGLVASFVTSKPAKTAVTVEPKG